MNKKEYKKIFLILTILIVTFVISKPTFAEDVYTAQGLNGIITSLVDMSPSTSIDDINKPFQVSGSIYSASTTPETVSLTATNNGTGSPITLISSKIINPHETISSGLISGFNSPNKYGDFFVNFITSVDFGNVPGLSSTGVGSEPSTGGTNDDLVVCDADLTSPSISGDQVIINYDYSTAHSGSGSDTCYLDFNKGDTHSEDTTQYVLAGSDSVNVTSCSVDWNRTTVLDINAPTQCR